MNHLKTMNNLVIEVQHNLSVLTPSFLYLSSFPKQVLYDLEMALCLLHKIFKP